MNTERLLFQSSVSPKCFTSTQNQELQNEIFFIFHLDKLMIISYVGIALHNIRESLAFVCFLNPN